MRQFSDPPGPVGAVWNADRIWVSTPQNRTLCVNLRKELGRYSRPLRYLRC